MITGVMLTTCAMADCDSENDCHGQCKHTFRHSCIGTVTDPFRTCESEYLDPACNLRCEAEKLACKNNIKLGCSLWSGNPQYEQGVAALRAAKSNGGITSRAQCLSYIETISTGGTVIGVGSTIWDTLHGLSLNIPAMLQTSTVTGVIKHGSSCACKEVFSADEGPPVNPAVQLGGR